MLQELKLVVKGMTCGGCESAIKRSLSMLEGVGDVTASHKHEAVTVTCDPVKIDHARIKQRIEEMGYTVE